MDIRNAILKAADHIEANPGQYNFQSNVKPDCGTPGCLMGWIGFYAGVERGEFSSLYMYAVRQEVGFDYNDLLNFSLGGHFGRYTREADKAAVLLRAYADAKFPATTAPAPTVELGTWSAIAKDVGFVPAGVKA